jgi:hypothetical protein
MSFQCYELTSITMKKLWERFPTYEKKKRSPTTPRVRTVGFNYIYKDQQRVRVNLVPFACVWYYYFGWGSSLVVKIFGSHGCTLEKARQKVGFFRILVLWLGGGFGFNDTKVKQLEGNIPIKTTNLPYFMFLQWPWSLEQPLCIICKVNKD